MKTPPAKLTPAALEQAALDYLGHYASSSGNLRRVLRRRIARADAPAEDAKAAAGAIDAIIARYLAAGLLDDRAYAAQQATSLARRGVSARAIAARLAQKGVAADIVRAVLGEAAPGGGELAAACALVRRRRLGPYRAAGARAAAQLRDLGILARAGFALDLARRVLAARDPDALDRLAGEVE